MPTVATWNVNSINARLENVLSWLKDPGADVVCLQEIKCVEERFPRLEIEALGYKAVVFGQKSYNGVAILVRDGEAAARYEADTRGLPGADDDAQARYLEVRVGELTVGCLYLPNGNPADTEKYDYKLAWIDRLIRRAKTLLAEERPFVLAGDFNVIPAAEDCYDPTVWADDALFLLPTRQKYRTLLNLGLTDALRAVDASPHLFTFWDYQRRAFEFDHGIRIDHLLCSPQAADRIVGCTVDRAARAREKASDHTPVVLTLADAA